MYPNLDIAKIEQEARAARAREIQRVQGLFAARLRLVAGLALGSLAAGFAAVGELLRPLFSWNPQDAAPPRAAAGPTLVEQANDALRSLFSWNPQAHRH